MRRDLTLNAISQDINGQLFDPFNGQQDLQNKVLRHVSDAFEEDPLRVLRVARFAARYHQYGFTVAPETIALMRNIAERGELASLSAERVFKEIDRSLSEVDPDIFFDILRSCQALEKLLPEIDKLWGIPNPEKWHPEICSGIHTMMVLKQAVKKSNNNAVRFAALCHDLGKGLTPEIAWPKHYGHEKSGLPVIKTLCKRLKVPTQYQQLAMKVCEFHLHSHKAFELKASTILKLFNKLDVWRKPEEFSDFLLCCEADMQGRLGFEDSPYPQAAYLTEMAEQARLVSAKKFIDQGIKGKDIKIAMDNEKEKVIEQIKQNHALKVGYLAGN